MLGTMDLSGFVKQIPVEKLRPIEYVFEVSETKIEDVVADLLMLPQARHD